MKRNKEKEAILKELVFTDNLKVERFKKKITSQQMAEKLGISLATYSWIENGRIEPKLITMNKISEILGKPVSYFFKINDYELPKDA